MYKTLVLSGGGVRGFAHLGALQLLQEKNILDTVEHYLACSVGTIISFLIIIGYRPNNLYEFLKMININKMQSFDFDNVLNNFGIDNGHLIMDMLESCLEVKMNVKNITFKQLHEISKKKLTVCATCINTRSETYFSHDTHPDLDVLLAIRMSISIPFLFTPVKYDNCYYIDGAVINNYPIDKVDTSSVLGIAIINKHSLININHFDEYIIYCINCFLDTAFTRNIDLFKKNTIKIVCPSYNMIEDLDVNLKDSLYQLGYNTAKDYLG